jgi:hypothetical protein
VRFGGIKKREIVNEINGSGEMAEWLKALVC